MRSRRLLILLFVIVAGSLAIVGAAAIFSNSSSCAYPAPIPSLPSALLSQGGFDQALAPSNTQSVQTLAQKAAVTLHASLIGAQPAVPVFINSVSANVPSAEIVPLVRTTAGVTKVVGLVVFLSDCSGQVYYSRADDLSSAPLTAFPSVDRASAQSQIGTNIALFYGADPEHPYWRNLQTGQSLPTG